MGKERTRRKAGIGVAASLMLVSIFGFYRILFAEEPLPGPIPLENPVAIDGDSVRGEAVLWPGLRQQIIVRLAGVDAPELSGACADERAKAEAARAYLAALIQYRPIFLTKIQADKYAGRVVAHLVDGEGRDLAALLRTAGHARSYDGKGAREGWC